MATTPLKYTYRVSGISEFDANNIGVALVQQRDDNYPPVPNGGIPVNASTWVLVVEKDRAAEFLPGDTYTVTFAKTT